MDSQSSSCSLPFQALMLLLFLAVALPGSQTAKDHSLSCTLQRTAGESVQLVPNCTSCPDIREIEWNWVHGDNEAQLLVSWRPNTSKPEWYTFDKKYKSRLFLTNMAFLNITNLIMEMSGVYTAKTKFRSGKFSETVFRLCVYEPVPDPMIVSHYSYRISGRCNVSLECGVPGATEHLTVTWESEDFLRELEHRRALGLNSWTLSLSLPLNQTNTSLTCVVSNPVDRKNVTLHLESICLRRASVQRKWYWTGFLTMVLMLMLTLGAGVWFWMRKKRKTGKGASWAAAPQSPPEEEDAELQLWGVYSNSELKDLKPRPLIQPKEDLQKDTCQAQSLERSSAVCTIYEKVRTIPGHYGVPRP